MNDDEHHNTFGDDPALDYIICRELEKEVKRGCDYKGKGGCLGLILFLILPACLSAVLR